MRRLAGHAEYVVRGRYIEGAILDELLAEHPRAGQLREQILAADPDSSAEPRAELTEILSGAIAARRADDTRMLGEAVAGLVAASVARRLTHELDAVYSAFLVDTAKADELEDALEALANGWKERIELRLIGPLAAYDFAGTAAPDSGG